MNIERKVSILMGVYNCELTVTDAILSIIRQTYSNWELIIVDDCSIDNTYKIVAELANNEPRIKLFRNEKNMTLGPTLNRCAKYATGDYFARMDGDDLSKPERLMKEVQFLDSHDDYDIVGCNIELFDNSGVYKNIFYKEYPDKEYLFRKSPFCHPSCLMRRSAFEKMGGYSEDMLYYRVEDYDLWSRMFRNGMKGYNIQTILYSFRDDLDSFKRRNLKNRINEFRVKINICNWFELGFRYRVISLITILKAFVPRFIYRAIHRK